MAILRLDVGCNAYIPHIHIGREAENDVSQIDFVVESWIDTYGDGGVSLAVQRYGDKEAYIVPLAIVDGVATWTISDTDTAKEGRGSIQLTYVVGEKVKKSQIYKIVVDSSLVGSDDVPDPYDNWLAILTEMTAQTGANADSARVSAQAAAQSEEKAKTSEDNAKASETAADLSETNAKESEVNAKASETAAAQSATNAKADADSAKADAQRAETAEANAEASAANAKTDADSARADADRAEQAAATSGYMWFYIENGKLYMDRTSNTKVNFYMQDGKLYVEEIA